MYTSFRKELLKSAIIIAGSIIVFFVGFYFISKSMAGLEKDIVAERLLIANNAAVIENLAELKRGNQEATRYESVMNKVLVPKDQLIDFPRWLDGIARIRRVDLRPVSFSGSEILPQESYPGYVYFTLDAQGSLNDLTSFLKDIELQSARFLVGLDTLDVMQISTGYRMTASGKVFFE